MAASARSSVELFHLVFMRALVAKGEDKTLIVLKGGCNLRFFFASVRYSEDIDFDVVVVSRESLRNKVDRLLSSPLVATPLRARGIELVDLSAPKQTDTTQRWKAGLRVKGLDVHLRTKIEFSRRDGIEGAAFDATDRDVLRAHGLTPILASHYTAPAAIAQKIHALAGRAVPQARDVFDLNHLLARPDAQELRLTERQRAWVPEAIERAMSISFDDYVAKVVAYLDREQAEIFRAKSDWEAMQEAVISRLERLR